MTIRLSELELSQRRSAIIALLTPLISDRNRIEIRQLGAGRRYVVGVINKGQVPSTVIDADTVRVPTKVRGVFLNYHEVWLPDQQGNRYDLDRAYMHLHLKKSNESADKQILCLHCDPLLTTGSPSFPYKKGPHLHVLGASPSIDRSHIAVCLNDTSHGGDDAQGLTRSLGQAIRMIEREIFPCYQNM
jgi:hypothetical protein